MDEIKTGELMAAERESLRLAMLPDIEKLFRWADDIDGANNLPEGLGEQANVVIGGASLAIEEIVGNLRRWCNEQEKGGGK